MRIFLLLLFLSPWYVFGQDTESIEVEKPSPILKFSLLSLLDPVSSIQFALEYPISRKSALQHEAGYVTRLFYNENGDKNMLGFRIRNEYRYYFYGDESPQQNFYVAPEVVYTHLWFERNERDWGVHYTEEDWENLGNGIFPEYPSYPVQKSILAIHPAKVGYQKIFNRFVLDMYGGLGYRHVRVKVPPGIVEDLDEFVSMRREAGVYNLWSLSLGFKLGYRL